VASRDEQLARGTEYQREGRHAEAKEVYLAVLRKHPNDADAWQLLGLALYRLGDVPASLDAFAESLVHDPRNAPTLANRALALEALGDRAGAITSLRAAITVRPGFPEAHARLGRLLLESGDAVGAEAAFRAADPTAPILADLGGALAMQGKNAEAVATWTRALSMDAKLPIRGYAVAAALAVGDLPHLLAAVGFDPAHHGAATALADVMAQTSAEEVRRGAGPRLRAVLGALLRQVRLDHQRYAHVLRAVVTGPGDPLFAPMLAQTIVADAGWETRLVGWRRDARGPGSAATAEALAVQAWLTEYGWAEAAGESAGLSGVEAAMYGPVPATPALAERMRPPSAEGIPTIALVTDATSVEVRAMYEENPYPRLVAVHGEPGTLPEGIPVAPEVLVAGCGTGQHPLGLAVRHPEATILAIDLSLPSLARARATAQHHGLRNVRFARCDLLALDALDDPSARVAGVPADGRFDWIDCVGVLHHLADPAAGLAVLLHRLRPCGRLRLGLYSKRARRDVVDARRLVQGNSPREARQFLLARNHPVTRSVDFYSLSGARDLLLHPCEHRYTPLGVQALLAGAGLLVTGLANVPTSGVAAYRARWPDDDAMADLARWEEIETENPALFAGMIQVWCRRG
jgi:SAM-dependent methyltransferase/Flp pilus assembly protein TadD